MTTPLPLIRLVDDDADVLEGLQLLLESEGWRVAAYASAEAFLTADAPSTPGCLVLDFHMPQMTGLELQKVMTERGYNLPIIFLTGHGDIDLAVAAVRRGAVDFLQKSAPDMNSRLIDAVARAVARSLEGFADLTDDPFEAQRKLAKLTERERLIVEKIAAGQLNRQIAAQLGISVRTAEAHRAAATRKLGVKSAQELVSLLRLAKPAD